MATRGDWVEIKQVILEAGDRAPQVPDDTAQTPLILKARGFLQTDARLGSNAEIETLAGRRLTGELVDETPGWDHSFGAPHAEMLTIGRELRGLLRDAEGGAR